MVLGGGGSISNFRLKNANCELECRRLSDLQIVTSDSVAAADAAPRASGVIVSLCFWLSLLVAGALFAGATLSGKILETERHSAQLAEQTARVEQLALEIRRLELEARALETDPEYIAAVARRQLGGKAVVAASEGARPAFVASVTFDPRLDAVRPWMIRLASDSLLRARLLTIAAALVLFAFTFLQEQPARIATCEGERPV